MLPHRLGYLVFRTLLAVASIITALTIAFPTEALAIQPSAPLLRLQESAFCAPGQVPAFQFGFAALKAQVGEAMGDPTECEHTNAENGDSLQATSTGLSFYRKSTNTPTFTNGFEHWGLTSAG